jgi:1-deoxy-D-xylulose 5-phosphate reductoisomerase
VTGDRLVVLGATGSIGRQELDIAEQRAMQVVGRELAASLFAGVRMNRP